MPGTFLHCMVTFLFTGLLCEIYFALFCQEVYGKKCMMMFIAIQFEEFLSKKYSPMNVPVFFVAGGLTGGKCIEKMITFIVIQFREFKILLDPECSAGNPHSRGVNSRGLIRGFLRMGKRPTVRPTRPLDP